MVFNVSGTLSFDGNVVQREHLTLNWMKVK